MLLEFRYRFEAAHRFLNADSEPCRTPHGHTWHATMCVEFTGAKLGTSQMTVEFSQVKKEWKKLIQETLDHSYLHNINDPIVEVIKNDKPRLLPFPGDPTTEMIALLLFCKMDQIISGSDFSKLAKVQFIKVEETPTNAITCHRTFYESEIGNFSLTSGWWNTTDIHDRKFSE